MIKKDASPPSTKLCFVVMGFGKKTDHETGRTLDLNATYNEIIKPAALDAGLRCVRADEVMHSGHIDLPMYEMLLRADLVIADISTGNANALYELGVRHALKPYSTIIMKESKGRFYFDLNHTSTFSYDHLGEDIGASEARRAKSDLKLLIEEILAKPRPDSPVYTFIPKLIQPKFSEEQFEELIQRSEETEKQFSTLVSDAEIAMREDRFDDAVRDFTAAVSVKPDDSYLTQQLALATYKNKQPSEIAALVNALKIIYTLSPQASNDPETIGITGAIHKRLWKITKNPDELALAIRYYGRGFEIRKDSYNGENYALCMNYQAEIETDEAEKDYYNIGARKTREELVKLIGDIIESTQFAERSDKKWILASMANALFGLARAREAEEYEKRFFDIVKIGDVANWEVETYQIGKDETLRCTTPVKQAKKGRRRGK